MNQVELLDYLEQRSTPEPNSGCILWLGTLRKGYGIFKLDGIGVSAHVVSWEIENGPVPSGLELDHLCRVTCCINPYHLEPVTHKENIRRSTVGLINRSKSHCPQGHEYSGANLIIENDKRHCRTCRNARKRAKRARADAQV